MELAPQNQSHGGLLFPLDAFRPTMLAAAFAELLVGKARNVLDATLEFTRHTRVPLVLVRIHGSVIDGDAAGFWAENPELCVYASQILPRQCFSYYVSPPPEQRQGFLVAQRGQPLAKEDGTVDSMPAEATAADWPVAKLCEQLQLSVDELASGFEGGPRIELNLMEPVGDDQELLRTLAGAPPEGLEDEPADGGDDGADPAMGGPPAGAGQPPAGAARRPASKADAVTSDVKRRETERDAERKERENRAATFADGLAHELDDFGIVVAPEAELSDADLLSPYVQRSAGRDLPAGVPTALAEGLTGRRIDFAVRVDFLSEVFVDATPVNKPMFLEKAQDVRIGDKTARAMEVLAPRLGAGSLVELDGVRVFVSRPIGMRLPEKLISQLVAG